MVSLIGSEALIPNPALKPFEAVIGEWETSGSHPYLPGRPLHGRSSFAWHEGGAFVIMHTEVDAPEIPSGVAVFGSDDEHGPLTMLYFDERGVSRRYDATITDRLLSWERLDPSFSQRVTLTFVPDGTRMTGRGEMSRDGAPWEGDLALDYVRVTP
ncbi:hypothetical protein [Leifsonia poae]|uniref:DUF1579 domain-containing protein n=1 Tax=Leifsonia poae TaxID=110933 RepID=A0A9W6H873_9MICO|nr:hypothetical protein [Leifsonia poae]GLJ75457.1 hypothetical protein GCM10017584_10310 [Leifsonia poae]